MTRITTLFACAVSVVGIASVAAADDPADHVIKVRSAIPVVNSSSERRDFIEVKPTQPNDWHCYQNGKESPLECYGLSKEQVDAVRAVTDGGSSSNTIAELRKQTGFLSEIRDLILVQSASKPMDKSRGE